MGVVFVLLLGEIDLSVGYVSGMGGVVAATLLVPDSNQWSTAPALIAALGAGLAIGLLQGYWFAKIGVPSFVVTLAGLLAWNGVVLLLVGNRGTVILQNDTVIGLANDFLAPAAAWILAIVCVALYAGVSFNALRMRRRAGLEVAPTVIIVARIVALAIAFAIVVAVANQDRGLPYAALVVAVLFIGFSYMLNRTRFGRHIYAVGGNAEAARRAGINVDNVKIACFALCSFLAVVGGVILASRLRSVDTNTGGGQALLYPIAAAVIGGTSLFGGRGTMKAAILGALVMLSIDNGLGLLGLSSGTKFVLTGGVLLLAVTVDSVSRRGRAQSGRA
jgi:D-xylose transport system permease protein